jgi:hypothetical protein
MSFKLRVILLEILLCEPYYSDNPLLTPRDEPSPVPEKLNRVDRTVVSTDLADLIAMHHVADMCLEARITAGHGSHNGGHTTSHGHVEFGSVLVAEERGDGDCVHWQFLLEVAEDFKSLGVQDFGAVVSCSG